MTTLLQYSGVLLIMNVLIFLVIIPLKLGLDPIKDTLSTFSTNSKSAQRSIKTGLVLGSLLQLMLVVYLFGKYSTEDSILLDIALYLFALCSSLIFLVAFIEQERFERIHNSIVISYFILSPMAIFLISHTIFEQTMWLRLGSYLLMIFYFLGQLVLYNKFKKHTAISEFYAFFIVAIWVLLLMIG